MRKTARKTALACLLVSTAALILWQPPADAQPPKAKGPAAVEPREKPLIDSLNGYALYQSYCATCHGIDAKGKGPMAIALKVPPADLTQIAVRAGGVFPMQRVRKIISGESETLSHGGREMPLWGPIFSQIAWDQDLGRVRVDNLARYLQSIQTAPRGGGR
ncbi:MAG: cytochrome c [Acidobacteriota bacterium]